MDTLKINQKEKLLLIGASGQLGLCFQDRLPKGWICWALDSTTLDITNERAVQEKLRQLQPTVIINLAAYTEVDRAEKDPYQAFAVNEKGTLYLAKIAEQLGVRFFHISTDYVFDGLQDIPYKESDIPNPVNIYGKSKLQGELLAFAYCSQTTIIRTSWLFSEYGTNFVKTMLYLGVGKSNIENNLNKKIEEKSVSNNGREQKILPVISDQIGCPTYAGDVAEAIIYLIQHPAKVNGLYHYCGYESISWSAFAEEIFCIARQYDIRYQDVKVKPVTSAEYKTVAKRPRYSVLDCSTFVMQGGALSDWRQQLKYVVKKLVRNSKKLDGRCRY